MLILAWEASFETIFSMFKRLFSFFSKKKTEEQASAHSAIEKSQSSTPVSVKAPHKERGVGIDRETRTGSTGTFFGLIARNNSHRGLRKGSKVYVRQILDDDRIRVRGTAPSGKKITLTVHRKAMKDYGPELIPEHVEKHYKEDSMFKEEHEALMKAEVLNKR